MRPANAGRCGDSADAEVDAVHAGNHQSVQYFCVPAHAHHAGQMEGRKRAQCVPPSFCLISWVIAVTLGVLAGAWFWYPVLRLLYGAAACAPSERSDRAFGRRAECASTVLYYVITIASPSVFLLLGRVRYLCRHAAHHAAFCAGTGHASLAHLCSMAVRLSGVDRSFGYRTYWNQERNAKQ